MGVERDFRYTLDGKEVEAFQVTEDSLFRDDLSPKWMNSKMLMTKGSADSTAAKHWLTVDDVETPIPKYGWIVRSASGEISAVSYEVMETAIKLVEDPGPERDPPSEVDEESLIQLQAAMQKRDPDEIRAERDEKAAKQPKPVLEIVDAPRPDDYPLVIEMNVPIPELVTILELFVEGETSAGIKALKSCLLQRVTWCNCAPGACEGGDRLGCRTNSPLV